MRLLFLLLLISACNNKLEESPIIPPIPKQAMETYANVYKTLDGTWEGKFYVYTDTRGQQKGNAAPQNIDKAYMDQLPLKEEMHIDVQQIYQSTSPYLQTVNITDTYTDATGKKNIVKSSGFNKVEKGRLWCIVNKPDETVEHVGRTEGKETIIWQRDIRNPKKIEFFKETVLPNTYTILGWGYYGNDDPTLTPKTWFFAEYRRVKE